MNDFDFSLVWEEHPNIKWIHFDGKTIRGYPGNVYVDDDGSIRFTAGYYIDFDPRFLPMETEEAHAELMNWFTSADDHDVLFSNPNNPGDWTTKEEHEQRMKNIYGNSNIGSRFD